MGSPWPPAWFMPAYYIHPLQPCSCITHHLHHTPFTPLPTLPTHLPFVLGYPTHTYTFPLLPAPPTFACHSSQATFSSFCPFLGLRYLGLHTHPLHLPGTFVPHTQDWITFPVVTFPTYLHLPNMPLPLYTAATDHSLDLPLGTHTMPFSAHLFLTAHVHGNTPSPYTPAWTCQVSLPSDLHTTTAT